MKKYALPLLLLPLLLAGCICRTEVIDVCEFEAIHEGQSIEEVMEFAGPPYEIRQCDDGREEYVYVVRQNLARSYRLQQHFSVYVEDGVVVDTDSVQEERHYPFYHLQHQHRRLGHLDYN